MEGSSPFDIEQRGEDLFALRFNAMASPCEVLVPSTIECDEALKLGAIAAREARRIETKYSRYRTDSVLGWIHDHRGTDVVLDAETASLMDFARHCHEVSGGLFDVTSGVLRHAWRFDGSDRLPSPEVVTQLVSRVGFGRLQWRSPRLLLPKGMELDFGGFGKEYAVDRAFELLAAETRSPFLLNFGGDMRANRPSPRGPWQVGIESPDADRQAATTLNLEQGALATSGDARRFLLKNGTRYGHILNPRTGWPIVDAPRSVTVAASSCTEAGLLATLALLQGRSAATFLAEQDVRHWVLV